MRTKGAYGRVTVRFKRSIFDAMPYREQPALYNLRLLVFFVHVQAPVAMQVSVGWDESPVVSTVMLHSFGRILLVRRTWRVPC